MLAREPNGFDNRSGFLKACSQDPVLGTVKLIAEPWDVGPGGYQVGYGKPPRDTRFKRGQSGNPKGRPLSAATILGLYTILSWTASWPGPAETLFTN